MPPFIPQKRRRLSTPLVDAATPTSESVKTTIAAHAAGDASHSLQNNKRFLDALDGSSDASSLSDVDSENFEDVLPLPDSKRLKASDEDEDEDEDDEEDGEIDWEDAVELDHQVPTPLARSGPSKDLEITLDNDRAKGSLTNPYEKKQGPSRIERQIRVATHRMHVQCLLFHNLLRNGWACDVVTQRTLVGQLPYTVKGEVDKWRSVSGIAPPISEDHNEEKRRRKARRDSRGPKYKRNQRDWGRPAERQETGTPNMSRGDPLLRLLKVLAAYWKKRFVIVAPGLRKLGYKPLHVLEEELATWKENMNDMEAHGERIKDLDDFRLFATSCEGSKDLGVQFFTALIRALGIDARLVASLQPLGFGWTKNEEASTKDLMSAKNPTTKTATDRSTPASETNDEHLERQCKPEKPHRKRKHPSLGKRRPPRGAKSAPIILDEGFSHDEEGDGFNAMESDDDSIIDVTPETPRRKRNRAYDRDMPTPTYWTEIISPISNEIISVDPFGHPSAVASSPKHIAHFESRGAKAEKAKQVFAYVIAYSADGSAKDVTTRYLKRQMWPGQTKGVRMPVEKVPVYGRKGKIKRYEEFDWVKRVLSGYERHHALRTAADDIEEAESLKRAKSSPKEAKVGEETLQGYKNSAEFVLERHLRREEALRPTAEPVKTFTSGKGDNLKEEPVFLRKDVEISRTAESWHKEGRAVKAGEQAMKQVPVRAVTANRKREVEEAERNGGGKLMQGMYARDQTDWIIPDPIESGTIPKNAFGNMDCFVPSMVPKGAVHIPLRSTVKVCKKLGIDYAEAVTGFEFGHRMAVPVLSGVVVAQENEHAVLDAWEHDEEERRIKEEGKREKQALALWRKWMLSLRVLHRVEEKYGDHTRSGIKDEMNPFINQGKAKSSVKNHSGDQGVQLSTNDQANGQKMVPEISPMEDTHNLNGGGFLLDEGEDHPPATSELTLEMEDHPNEDARGKTNSFKSRVIKEALFPQLTKSCEKYDEKLDSGTKARSARRSQPQTTPPKTPRTNQPQAADEPDGQKPLTTDGSPRRSSRAATKQASARKSAAAVTSHSSEQQSSSGDDSGASSPSVSTSPERPVRPIVKGRLGRPSTRIAKRGRPRPSK